MGQSQLKVSMFADSKSPVAEPETVPVMFRLRNGSCTHGILLAPSPSVYPRFLRQRNCPIQGKHNILFNLLSNIIELGLFQSKMFTDKQPRIIPWRWAGQFQFSVASCKKELGLFQSKMFTDKQPRIIPWRWAGQSPFSVASCKNRIHNPFALDGTVPIQSCQIFLSINKLF